ncbi:ABC transporter permease [Aquicella lusitana]|uniref:Putative hydroxymethylpyrimidine transport system permease protein n=1 Tax=Aquicella lusitana TaxID=254246 RepID=A0A370GGC3_9COXI|nr:ABC transporter permease [Aquicella lusitana]RDI42842.1 putative hydroxymethylpyrimidine transport system permease protein [Aquicella lusitana]VVC73085.1 Putative aliphatic sulfonates transport permease protein SsuC [Aquicella lusitana]
MRPLLRMLLITAGLLLLWQGIVQIWQLPDYLLPPPWQVFATLYQQRDLIAVQAIPTLYETIAGFLLGIFFGAMAAIVVAFVRPLTRWFLPILIISQAIPTFVIAPLLVIWLGYGTASKIATTTLMIFFPITSAFYDGLRKTNPDWLALARVMHVKEWRIFLHIRIPAALPALASGIRIAAVVAPIGAVVGEWVGSSHGLGYLMLNANARLQIDMMFAALIVIILLALTLYFSVDRLLRRLVWWN